MPATAEPPVAMTPIDGVFNKALAGLQAGKSETEVSKDAKAGATPIEAITETVPAEKKEAPKEQAAPAKPAKAAPKSALDAVLGGGDAAPAEKPAETEVETDPLEAFPEDAKNKDWKGLRGVAKTMAAELKELRAKAGKAEPDPAVLSELTTVKAQLKERETALAEREAKLAEYSDAMTAVNLELHPDFRKEFIDARKELVQEAASKFKKYGGTPETIIDALSLPEGKRRDQAIDEALNGLDDVNDTSKDKIRRIVADIEAKDEKREKAIGNSQHSYAELERKTLAQQQKRAAESERVRNTEFERITRDLHKSVPTLGLVDESIEGGKEWNASVKQAHEDALKLFSSDASFQDIVTAAVKGNDYDRITKMLVSERRETATLRAQLAQYEGATPDIKGGKAPAKSKADAQLEKSPDQLFTETMAKLSSENDL